MLGSYSFIAAVNGNGDEPIEPIPPLLWGPLLLGGGLLNDDLNCVAMDASAIVIGGRRNGAINSIVSFDQGVTWSPTNIATYNESFACGTNNGKWGIGAYKALYISTSGAAGPYVSTTTFSGIIYSVNISDSGNVLATSNNKEYKLISSAGGLISSGVMSDSVFRSCYLGGDRWLMCGGDDAYYTDDNFITFTTFDGGFGTGWDAKAITSDPLTGLVVAVFYNGKIAYSRDFGVDGTWIVSALSVTNTWLSVGMSSGYVVAGDTLGRAKYAKVDDLDVWFDLPIKLNSGNPSSYTQIRGIAGYGGIFVNVQNDGFMSISPPLA